MTKTLKEQQYMSDVVKYDVQEYSRDDGLIASGTGDNIIGTVLGKNDAGKYVPLDLEATTGEQVVAGVLLTNVSEDDAADQDVEIVVLSRHATVADNSLVWPEGITSPEKAAAISELAAIGIIARREN